MPFQRAASKPGPAYLQASLGKWGEARIYGGGDGGGGAKENVASGAGTTGLAPTQELHVEIPRAISACQSSQRLGWRAECLPGVREALGPAPGTADCQL